MFSERGTRSHRENNIVSLFRNMSFFNLFKTPISLIKKEIIPALYVRTIRTGNPTLCDVESAESGTAEEDTQEKPQRIIHPIEKCLEYMDSQAYKITYGDKPVWHVYVRNFKGSRPPKTRKNCWKFGRLNRSSPCPICRDQYLRPHYLNVKLLQQFLSPYGGQLLDSKKTGVCQKQQMYLEAAIVKAKNYGLLTYSIPYRTYDYSLYNKK